ALQEQERVEGAQARPVVPHQLDPRLDDVGQGADVLPVRQAVVARVRLHQAGELAAAPVEAPAVHDDAADGVAVAADPLGGRVDHDVGPPLQRPAQVGRGEGVVDDQRQAVLVGHPGHGLDVEDVQLGIADGFGVDALSPLVDGPAEVVGIRRIHEVDLDAQVGQAVGQQVEGTAVEAGRRHHLVAGAGDVGDGQGGGGLAAGGGQGGGAAFQGGHPLLEHVHGGVHDAGVDVARLLQVEEPG